MSPDQNPQRIITVLRYLVEEAKRVGVEALSVGDLEKALDALEAR